MTKNDAREWFEEGVQIGATHMIIVCDTFVWDDYPVYVKPEENCETVYKNYSYKNMQKVMEIYDLKADMEKQLNQERAWALK